MGLGSQDTVCGTRGSCGPRRIAALVHLLQHRCRRLVDRCIGLSQIEGNSGPVLPAHRNIRCPAPDGSGSQAATCFYEHAVAPRTESLPRASCTGTGYPEFTAVRQKEGAK